MGRPIPVTVTDELLAQMLDVLGEIRDHLVPPPAPAPTGPVEVREPEQPAARVAASPPPPAPRGRRTTKNNSAKS